MPTHSSGFRAAFDFIVWTLGTETLQECNERSDWRWSCRRIPFPQMMTLAPFWIHIASYSRFTTHTSSSVADRSSQFQTQETTLHYIVGGPRKGNGVQALGALVLNIFRYLTLCLL